jgi:para-nitrobenzyl esterase
MACWTSTYGAAVGARQRGGDPGAVTLVGHGAEAASVLLHATSPRANGLFRRVLAMSGSPLAPWAGQQRGAASVVAGSRRIADNVGCLKQDVGATMACLRRVPTQDLMHAFQKQYNCEC